MNTFDFSRPALQLDGQRLATPGITCIHHLFEAQVRRNQYGVALVCDGEQMTYGELDRRANQLAHYLQALGVGPNVLVGLCVERSLEMVVGLLGILKAGGAYVPLDSTYPIERLKFMLADAHITVLVTQQSLVQRFGLAMHRVSTSIVCLDADSALLVRQKVVRPVSDVTVDDLVYIIYTSGSTGRPKGVQVTHASLYNLVGWYQHDFGLTVDDRATQLASPSFDAAGFEIWPSLTRGASIFIVDDQTRAEASRLRDWLVEQRITITFAPTILAESLLTLPWPAQTTLRLLLTGGDALHRYPPAALPFTLVNNYGPTETTIVAAASAIPSLEQAEEESPSIGRPIANTYLYVLDTQMQELPVGAVGELYIGGEGLARGYLNQQVLTAEKFVPDPFSERAGARLYRTGDLVRKRTNGDLEFLGRVDHQIKIRGFRIELGEIEALLRVHPSVQDAVVQAQEDGLGEKRLVAYVVTQEKDLMARDLRASLREKLPAYMLPAAFVMLESLPLSSNGKLDRHSLPAVDFRTIAREESYVAPRTQVEEVLARIWASVFKYERIGLNDNFFELGGHSLIATQIIARVRDQLGCDVPIQQLFAMPRLADLARWIEESGVTEDVTFTDMLHAGQHEGRCNLSHMQRQLWFLEQLAPGNSMHNVPVAMRLEGRLDRKALEQSIQQIVQRHESLRTLFREQGGVPQQHVLPTIEIPVHLVEVEERLEQERNQLVQQALLREVQRPFDLGIGPLLRVTLFRLAPEQHVLLLVLHHIITDGWSMGVLFQELETLYHAYSTGQPTILPELPMHSTDFARWQQQRLQGTYLEHLLSYWKTHLQDAPSLLQLPTDRPRPSTQTFRGAVQTFQIAEEQRRQLEALGQREGATLFMTLLAVFQVLLYRYTGEENLVVGTPVANRTQWQMESLVGFFVNTLALHTQVEGEATFRELLERVKQVALGAYAHQELPFNLLIEELRPERDTCYNPVCQVVFALQTAAMELRQLHEVKVSPLSVHTGNAQFDLTLEMREEESGLVGAIEYNTDLFDASTIERMAQHFQQLLLSALADPDQAIARLPMMTAVELRQVLVDWNQTQREYPQQRCIHELFEEQVQRTPEATAIIWEGEEISYRVLNTRANRLAQRLRRLGVRPDVLVGLCVLRSIEMAVGLLGILKAGGAYVPLDPAYPEDRLTFMVQDAAIKVLLTQKHVRLPAYEGPVLYLDADLDAELSEPESAAEGPAKVSAANLAYVMYTSGSTGRPKGVAIEHRSIVRLLFGVEYLPLDASRSILHMASISFDAATFEIWGALLHGAKCVFYPNQLPTARSLQTVIQQHRITTMLTTTALFNAIIDEDPTALAGIEHLLAGGEAQSVRHISRALQALPGTQLINGYGPTESTTLACCYSIPPSFADTVGSVPIGCPIANTRVYILDAHLQPVPVGVTGELYIGGAGVARGYLHQPELTAQRFVADPFSQEPGARLYKTGDLVRYRSDGMIEFFGRRDHQIKLRGFRIELGEIEAALTRYPAIKECVVTVHEETLGDKRLVAYVVRNEDQPFSQQDLHAFLCQWLPDYMVPSVVLQVARLPLTVNGKIDLQQLSQLASAFEGGEAASRTPRTPVEEIIAAIWMDVLNVERVSICDDFFALGGHSLLVMKVISRLREAFQVELPVAALFTARTVADLALLVEQVRSQQIGSLEKVQPVVSSSQENLPLSLAQERIWFLDQMNQGNSAYLIATAHRLRGSLDAEILQQSVQALVLRHASLRTVFPAQDGRPVQKVQEPEDVCCYLVQKDLCAIQEREQTSVVVDYAEDLLRRPMDLAQGPLLHIHLLRLAAEEYALILVVHHIVADGWSLHIFYHELAALYNDFVHQRQSQLEPLAIQFADYAIWERRWLQGSLAQNELSYWQCQLSGAPTVLELPTDSPRPPVQTYAGASLTLHVTGELTDSLDALSQREGVTLSMTLLAAFAILLSRYTGQEDILVGTPTAGRDRRELEDLIGLFLNILVIRTKLSDNPMIRDVLKNIRETTLEAYAHQHVPFEQLLNHMHIERDLSRTPLFQVFFNMLNFPDRRMDFSGIATEGIPLPMTTSKYDMTLYIEKQKQGLRIDLAYNADLFHVERMRELLGQFNTLLAQMLRTETRLADLSLVTSEARSVLPDPQEPLSAAWKGSVHDLLACQACRVPDRIAVADQWESITYAELERRSTLLAQRLHQQGIGNSDVVAVYAHRNAVLTWAVFGVLKAGAALLILDPAYPPARLITYLRLAEARFLLTIPEGECGTKLPRELDEYISDQPGGSCLYLARAMFAAEAQSAARPPQDSQVAAVGPDDIAFITFTSGSTGQPRAVQQRHGPLTHFLEWQQQRFELEEQDRYSMFAGLAHDPLQREIFTSLCLGATLCIPATEKMGIPSVLVEWMHQQQVTIAHLTPAMMQLLTQCIASESSASYRIPSLRCAFTVGDALTGRDVARLLLLAPHVTCVNFYGSTETQRAVGYYIVPRPQSQSDDGIRAGKEVIPLGKGFPDAQLLILNQGGQLAGVSEVGEIYLRSPHLAKGYAHDLKATQERFLTNPFTGQNGDTIYRTGDLGRYRPDGNVEYAGRKDQQVKLRGYRIELAEIEAVLRSHPLIQDVAAILREDIPGHRYLAAYVVLLPAAIEQSQNIPGEQLRPFVSSLLPSYMVPTAFEIMESLPLTPNLKVDRRALPAPNLLQNTGSLAPRTPTEELLENIWSEILELERIGIQENFFEIGGHSLLATQIISRLRDVFQLEVPLRALFEAPTIGELAEWIEQMCSLVAGERMARVQPVSREGYLPLSFAQQRLWFLDQLEPGSSLYTLHAALRLQGQLEPAMLERSLNEIVCRHEVLRTYFDSERGQARQIIVPELHIPLPVVDLSPMVNQQQREEEAKRLALREAKRPFDLASGPLLRTTLLKLGQHEHILLLTAHHSVIDGWSDSIFIKELTTCYKAFSLGQLPSLPALPVHYADFAVWQRERLKEKHLEAQFGYWKQQLQELPPALTLPFANKRPAVQSFRGRSHPFILTTDLTERIKTLSQREGVTLFMTLLGAFDALLSHLSSQEDLIVGTPIAGRTQSELEPLIGCFVNTLALRVDLSGNPSFLEVLSRVRKVTLEAYANQEVPFELLVDEVVHKRSLSHHPLFQTMFVFQNLPDERLELPGLTLDLIPIDTGCAMFDLTFRLREDGSQLRGDIEYSTDLFTSEAIEGLLKQFIALLEAVVSDPMCRLLDIPLRDDGISRGRASVNGVQRQINQDELFAFELE